MSKLIDKRKKGFDIVYKDVVCHPKISAQAKGVYAYLAAYAGSGSDAFPAPSRYEKEMGMSRVTFKKHVKSLSEFGFINVVRREREDGSTLPNDYYLVTSEPTKHLKK